MTKTLHQKISHFFSPKSWDDRRITAASACLLCMVYLLSMLLGTTQASFTATAQISDTTKAKYFALQTTNRAGSVVVDPVTFTGSEPMIFTLTPQGGAQGYCKVTNTLNDSTKKIYYITPIQSTPVNLSLTAALNSTISFDYGWGKIPEDGKIVNVNQNQGSIEDLGQNQDPGQAESASTFTLSRSRSLMSVRTAAEFASGSSRDASPVTISLVLSETPFVEYIVPERATIQAISGHYGVSIEDILIFNDLESAESIAVGDTLRIPNPTTEKPYEPPQIYIVVEGDTLQKIAEMFHVTIASLRQWNNFTDETLLYPGMKLEIPVLYENIVEEEPEETVPEETVPEETVPEETVPEETVPEETVPEETVPEETVPEETVPEETVPEETEPEETVPEETEPEETEPEETEPEETEPEETEPEETVPEETVPEETVPEETVPEETQPAKASEEEKKDDTVYVNGVPRYFQTDYPNVLYGAGTVSTSGCSVTSLTMVANAVTGYDYTVDELAEYFGGRAENNIKRLELGSETLGLSFYKSENWDETWAALEEGKIVIALMEEDSLFTASQHFIVLTGLTEDGERIMINDPNANNYNYWNLIKGFENGFDPDSVLLGYSGAWVYDRELEDLPERYSQPRMANTYDNMLFGEEEPEQNNYPELKVSAVDRELLARLVWAEARGESAAGQQAVAEVALNRVLSCQFGDSVNDVIYGEGQFRTAPILDQAEPGQAQYEAVDRALFGEPILNRNVLYFATYRTNNNVFMQIGKHIFCY